MHLCMYLVVARVAGGFSCYLHRLLISVKEEGGGDRACMDGREGEEGTTTQPAPPCLASPRLALVYWDSVRWVLVGCLGSKSVLNSENLLKVYQYEHLFQSFFVLQAPLSASFAPSSSSGVPSSSENKLEDGRMKLYFDQRGRDMCWNEKLVIACVMQIGRCYRERSLQIFQP